jgi:hypothetical protein
MVNVWIEKTYGSGRLPNDSIGSSAYGPKHRYKIITETKPGDFVIHIEQDSRKFIGISRVSSDVKDYMAPDGEWKSQESYRIFLSNFKEISPPLNISDFFKNADGKILLSIRDNYRNIFYILRSTGLGLGRGDYFTRCPFQLLNQILLVAEKLNTTIPYEKELMELTKNPKTIRQNISEQTPIREEQYGQTKAERLNIILYGPPGTGKTFQTRGKAVSILSNTAEV